MSLLGADKCRGTRQTSPRCCLNDRIFGETQIECSTPFTRRRPEQPCHNDSRAWASTRHNPSEFRFGMGLGPLGTDTGTSCLSSPCKRVRALNAWLLPGRRGFGMCGLPCALFLATRPPASAVPRGGPPAAQHKHNTHMFLGKGRGRGHKHASFHGDCSKSSPTPRPV